jgi:hypothetical protein
MSGKDGDDGAEARTETGAVFVTDAKRILAEGRLRFAETCSGVVARSAMRTRT